MSHDIHLTGCNFCIEDTVPQGIHPVFGPVLGPCPTCIEPCPGCDGTAFFPATTGYAIELLYDAVYALGFDVEHCRHCVGILGVHPTTDPEVTP